MTFKALENIGKDIIAIAEGLRDTDQKAEINDLLLSLDLLKDQLNRWEL